MITKERLETCAKASFPLGSQNNQERAKLEGKIILYVAFNDPQYLFQWVPDNIGNSFNYLIKEINLLSAALSSIEPVEECIAGNIVRYFVTNDHFLISKYACSESDSNEECICMEDTRHSHFIPAKLHWVPSRDKKVQKHWLDNFKNIHGLPPRFNEKNI